MKKITYIKSVIIYAIVVVMALSGTSCGGLRLHSEKLNGIPSSEIWFEENNYHVDSIPALVKKTGEDYKILLLADTQLDGAPGRTRKALKLVEKLVELTKPDFIVALGDNTEWFYSDIMAKKLTKTMEQFNTPWSVVLGNHDSEGRKGRAWYGNHYEAAKNSLFQYGPSNIHGVGNYSVLLKDEQGNILYSFIMMDSNVGRKYESGDGYDFIHRDQINWYRWQVKGVSAAKYGQYNPETGKVVPSICFFHIPLPEYADAAKAWKAGEIDSTKVTGENREGVASAKVNSGLFDVMKNLKSTTHVFVGHDHVNNLSVQWQGIWLSYGLKTGPTSYFAEDMQGGTLVSIGQDADDKSVKVKIKYIFVKD
ncbi:MAG: hypothetical protein DRJ10_00370 [Bacteroidetes bacterium]|nr:MAG: hypothetical protein DRJ10_00370 [Bacteroidota bacterium]RLD85663.1 MAG: hypothetical protein DRJ07_02575 [Bacteroidota bacterium]